MSEVSTKLIEVQRAKAVNARIDAMFDSLRVWRSGLIAALAQRDTEIGMRANDPEMLGLMREMRLLQYVSGAMSADAELLIVSDPNFLNSPR
jgi:hypothetical protein